MISFTESMKTGIGHIDDQHRILIDFVNKMALQHSACGPTDEEMNGYLSFLGEYLDLHLNDEEVLQHKIKYPRMRLHKEIHREFVQTFDSVCLEFDSHGASRELHRVLVSRVSSWIITHIKVEDRAFGEYYAKARLDQLKLTV